MIFLFLLIIILINNIRGETMLSVNLIGCPEKTECCGCKCVINKYKNAFVISTDNTNIILCKECGRHLESSIGDEYYRSIHLKM